MNLTFIKINFILFEIVSFVLTAFSLIGLFYFSLVFPRMKGLKPENQKLLTIYFNVTYNPGVLADIDIDIIPELPEDDIDNPESKRSYTQGVIAYNQNNFDEDLTKSQIVAKINSMLHDNIHIFSSNITAQQYLTNIRNIINDSNSIYSPAIICVVISFCFFMKVTLIRTSIQQIRGIKSNKKKMNKVDNIIEQLALHSSMPLYPSIIESETNSTYVNDNVELMIETKSQGIEKIFHKETQNALSKDKPIYNPILSLLNPKNLFNLFFFELTCVIILPLIFPRYTDVHILNFYGFRSNMFSSVYYYRSRFGQADFDESSFRNDLVFTNDTVVNNNYFWIHQPMKLTNYEGPDMNPYLFNLMFLCCVVWMSKFFRPFDKLQKKVEANIKKSKIKTIMKYVIPIAIFVMWGVFFVLGFINMMEYMYLFHRQIVFSFQKIFDVKITLFIASFYFHIYFYVIMLLYTCHIIIRNKSVKMVLV